MELDIPGWLQTAGVSGVLAFMYWVARGDLKEARAEIKEWIKLHHALNDRAWTTLGSSNETMKEATEALKIAASIAANKGGKAP